jgi:hypothetical protein
MEREKEIYKLVNVLRRTARMAMHSHWTGSEEDTAAHCAQQYNRVLSRLTELDSSIEKVFAPLAQDSSLTVVAMACRQLAAYFEDEAGAPKDWGGEWRGIWAHPRYGIWLDKKAFKEFWEKSAHEIEDLGEFIRENIENWFHQKHDKQKKTEEPPKQPHPSEGGSWKDDSV